MMIQVKPLCVLDFYVHESVQRRGLGARLLALACQVRTSYIVHPHTPRWSLPFRCAALSHTHTHVHPPPFLPTDDSAGGGPRRAV